MTSSKLLLSAAAVLVLGGSFFAHDSSIKARHQADLSALTRRLTVEHQALIQEQKLEASRLAERVAELESHLEKVKSEGDEDPSPGSSSVDESGLPTNAFGSRQDDGRQSTSTEKLAYVASQRSTKFHSPDCRSANTIKAANMVFYSSRDAAVSAGKEPCSLCRP